MPIIFFMISLVEQNSIPHLFAIFMFLSPLIPFTLLLRPTMCVLFHPRSHPSPSHPPCPSHLWQVRKSLEAASAAKDTASLHAALRRATEIKYVTAESQIWLGWDWRSDDFGLGFARV
jgi:hypothetical protein